MGLFKREAYGLGVLIFISINVVMGQLESECISSALCFVMKGDIQRDNGQPFQESYDLAQNETKKYMKFLHCGIEKINEKCEQRGKDCMNKLKVQATMNYASKGLGRDVFHECPVGAWSYVLFLCKNQKNWPKFVTDNIPKQFMICNSTCPTMSEFDEYHRRNGKTDADFPPLWKEKLALMEENKKLTEGSFMEATDLEGGVEKRQRVSSKPWLPKSIVERLTFGNEFLPGDSFRPMICDQNTWIITVAEFLPRRILFSCATFDGVKNPTGPKSNYVYPEHESGTIDKLGRGEAANDNHDLSPTRIVVCQRNKFKKYQADNPLLVGVQFRIDGSGRLDSGRYLCAGDSIITPFTKNVLGGDRPDITSRQRCPALTAICSVGGRFRDRDIVQLTFGCCPVEALHIQNAQIFEALPYTWGGVVRNTSRTYESAFTGSFEYYYFTFGELERRTYLCPPNYFIDSFKVNVIVPSVPTVRCNHIQQLCYPPIPYLISTRLYCNTVQGRSDRKELKGLGEYWNSVAVGPNPNPLSSITQTCTQGFYNGGELECNGNTLSKKFKCGDQFQVGEKKFYPALYRSERSGWWSLTEQIDYETRFRSLPDFQVEFKCPPATAICGVGVVGGKNVNVPTRSDVSVEGLFYDHLCCPITLQLCTEAEIRVQLDLIPSHCSIPSGVNGTCIISYVTSVVQVYENNTNTMRSESDKLSWSVGGMIGVGPATVANVTVGLAGGYSSVSEKVKLYQFETTVSTTESFTTNTTQLFFLEQGRTLLTYRPFIYCGGFKVGSRNIISIQTPSTNCVARDEFLLFREINGDKVERKVNVTFVGYGTRWTVGRAADQIDIPWASIITNLPSKFNADPFIAISPETKFRWQSVDKEVFGEYNPVELSFEYTIKPGLKYKFSRVIGFCGNDWVVLPRVTAQNVHVETVPV